MSLRLWQLAAFAYVLVLMLVALEVPLALNLSRRVDAEIKAEAANNAQLVAASAAGRLGRPDELERLELRGPGERADRAGGDELRLVGRLGLDLGVDALGEVEGERDLERDEHQHEHVREGRELPDAHAHRADPSAPAAANMNPTPRTVWM